MVQKYIEFLECDECGYSRAAADDGQQFHDLLLGKTGVMLLCHNCYETYYENLGEGEIAT